LIREWELLRQWLDQDRANLLQQRKIEALAQEWEKSGKKSEFLLQGFRLKEARKFQKEQALQYPLKKLGSDFIAKSVGKQRQNWLKWGEFPLIAITFVLIRIYTVQSDLKIVQETQGEKYDIRRIKAVESLVFWRESFENIPLEKADLHQINLSNANFRGANLTNANLRGAKLLYGANFTIANLRGVDLDNADLGPASLDRTELNDANLTSAILINAQNLTNTQIKSACFWEKAIYKGHFDVDKDKWITDEKANQAFIAQLKQDKASDPKDKPDCSKWKK
jgi:hypothetical protein